MKRGLAFVAGVLTLGVAVLSFFFIKSTFLASFTAFIFILFSVALFRYSFERND